MVVCSFQMADEVTQIRERITDKLRADKVKLWLPPFTTETLLKGEHPTVSLVIIIIIIYILLLYCY